MTPNQTDRSGLVERLLDHHDREIWDWDLLQEAAVALRESQAEVDAWKSQVYDEVAANLKFREDGGALPDEDMPTFCARLLTELAALREDAWLPIESAPRDGKDVLVAEYGDVVVAHWSVAMKKWYGPKDSYGDPDVMVPTHWRPLPAPPKPSGDGGGG